jgi:hypothetical protein
MAYLKSKQLFRNDSITKNFHRKMMPFVIAELSCLGRTHAAQQGPVERNKPTPEGQQLGPQDRDKAKRERQRREHASESPGR